MKKLACRYDTFFEIIAQGQYSGHFLVMKLARVVFPGYVKDKSKAVSILGGSKEIYSKLTKDDQKFLISFRPNDQLTHPIESSTKNDPCILIRVKVVRKYKIIDGQKKLVEQILVPEFLGKADQCVNFSKPSDFQFLPQLKSPLYEQTVFNPPPQNFLFLPPPVFIHNYNYDARYLQKRIFSLKQHESSKMWKKDDCSWVISQNDLHSLEDGPKPPPIAHDVIREYVEIFEEMFEERPIWTTLAIFDHLLEMHETRGNILDLNQQSPQLFHCLACVAYHIKNGPFQMCWVRYGINPLVSNSYAKLQTFILSLRDWQYADSIIQINRKSGSNRLISKRISDFPQGMSKMESIPERLLYSIQLIDIKDKFVQDLIKGPSNKFSYSVGWYSQNTIDTIRKFCLLKLQRLILDKNQTSPSIIMGDIISADQIQKELDAYKKKPTAVNSFDFEFTNQAQAILGTYDSSGSEQLSDLLDLAISKTASVSYCRLHSY